MQSIEASDAKPGVADGRCSIWVQQGDKRLDVPSVALTLSDFSNRTANAFNDSQPNRIASRIRTFDLAKGMGIVAVVVGHVLVGMVGNGLLKDKTWPELVLRWIHFWHMPLFVFLSGILAHRILTKSNSQYWGQTVEILILPYLLWGTLQVLASHLFSQPSSLSLANEVLKLYWQPPMQFWFIYFLFVTQLAFFGLTRLSKSPWLFCVLALAMVLVLEFSGIPPRSTSMVNRFRQNLPWYVLGIIVSTSVLKLLKSTETIGDNFNAPFCVPWTFYGLGAVFLASINTVLLVLPIYEMPHWLRVLVLPVPGLMLMFCLAQLIRGTRLGTTIEYLGKHSFPIYLAHVLGYVGTRVCLVKGLGITNPSIHIVVGIVGGLVFPLVLLFLGNRFYPGFPFEFRLRMLGSQYKT